MEKKYVQLYSLSYSLREMVSILSLDDKCPWVKVFTVLQKKAETLLCSECTHDELERLSSAIIILYRIESGFADYAPLEFNSKTGGYYYFIGAENFTDVSWKIYSVAEEMLSDSENELTCKII
jgi:hypothetical protein